MDFISIHFLKGLDFLADARIIIMENKNYAIFFHVFICKTKYPIHIVIYVTILGRDNNGRYGDKINW
jgi:hypothetical protein